MNLEIFLETHIAEGTGSSSQAFVKDADDFVAMLSKIPFDSYDNCIEISFVDARLVRKFKDKIFLEELISKPLLSDFFVINFSINITNSNYLPHSLGSLAYHLANILQRALVVGTIARPLGPFGPLRIIVTLDRSEVLWHRQGNLMLLEHINQAVQIHKWPVFKNLDLWDTWIWANSRSGFTKNRSNSKVSRSLSCLTQLFTDSVQEHYLFLIWSMIGLEAITNSGPMGAQHTFYTRIFDMIGVPTKRVVVARKLYQERSKLLHGQYDLPGQFVDLDFSNDESVFPEALYDAQGLSAAMLIAVLQYCARNKLSDITFEMIKKETIES